MWQSVFDNIKQLLLIVFSVVLGIFLSERIEERKNEKEAALLLSKITSEVSENQKLLEDWVPYHGEIVDLLDSLARTEAFVNSFIEDESIFFEKIFTRGTLMGRSPSNDAWDIAKSHPLIVHFDYADLLILSKIYHQQEVTYKSVPKIIELLLSADFNSQDYAQQNLQLLKNQLEETFGRELQLMNYFREAEKTLAL